MPNITANETILLDLGVEQTQRVLVEPAFNYDNPLQRQLRVAYFEFGKDKLRMLHLSKPGNMLQPKSNCDTWNPTVRLGLRPDEIAVSDFEMNGEQCSDEFDAGCLRNLQGNNPSDPSQMSTQMTALEAAIALQVRRGLTDDIYKIAYFGNTAFSAASFTHMTPDAAANMERMLTVTDGWWAELTARVTTTNAAQKVAYVNSNDGTLSGNAINPSNVTSYLQQLKTSSNPVLRYWNLNKPIQDRPMYLVQGGIFNALKKYYRSLGTELAHAFTISGEVIPGVLEFDGHLVVHVSEWDMFDYECNNIQTTTITVNESKTQRALFVAKENLTGLANVGNIEGYAQSGLIIQTSPLVKDKGKKWMFFRIGLGFGIAAPQLVTASYNSSTTFTYS